MSVVLLDIRGIGCKAHRITESDCNSLLRQNHEYLVEITIETLFTIK